MHAVIITPGFPENENDHSCLPFLQLYLKELIKQNVIVTVITDQYPRKENYTWHSIPVYTLRKKEIPLFSKIVKQQRLKKIITKINHESKINVLHKFWFDDLIIALQNLASKLQIKMLTTFTGQDVLSTNKALRQLHNFKGELICVSLFQKNKLLEKYKTKTHIIGWGTESIDIKHQQRSIDLIAVGSLNTIKNYSQFIEIVNELNKVQLAKKVIICGSGQELNTIQQKIKDYSLESVIELKRNISRSEVLNLMQQSKILVHTSHYESFGMVLIEGLACGCAVVSKETGIAVDNTSIIKCTTTQEFVSQLTTLLLKDNIVNENKHDYIMSNTVREYLQLYNS